MPTTDQSLSSLQQIQIKARRLTRSPSENQLSTSDLNNYINTFILYDFPEQLRLFNLHTTFTFYTQPYVDVYESNTDSSSPFYNFKNKYITVNPPVYIAGYQALYSQSREQFFSIYPLVNSIASIGTAGNGSTTSFSGTINAQQANTSNIDGQVICLLKNNVLFSSIDLNNNGLAMIDYPISNTIGNLYIPGGAPTSTSVQDTANYINYITGQFVVTFASAPGSGQPINSQTVPQMPTLPQSVLFYDGKFTMRPVPDQAYQVKIEADIRPTELLASDDVPELSEWWQFIAYGAAIKIFQDRMDTESVQQIYPEFRNQLNLINRRTIVQQTTQRVATIYTEQTGGAGAYGSGLFGGGGNF